MGVVVTAMIFCVCFRELVDRFLLLLFWAEGGCFCLFVFLSVPP